MLDSHEQEGLGRLRDFVLWRRKPQKWTQTVVADRSGLSQSWVASLEASRLQSLPQPETLTKLAKGLALPGEDPAKLFRFLEFLPVSHFDVEDILRVAAGREKPEELLRRHIEFTASLEPGMELPPDDPDFDLGIRLRKEGRALVLQMLKRDLPPDDFAALRHLVNLMYDRRDELDGVVVAPWDGTGE